MSKSGQLFMADRLRQEGEERDMEYAEYCYLHGIAPPGRPIINEDPGDQQEEKPTGETAPKPKK